MYIVFVPCLSFEGLAMEQSVGSSSLSLDGNDISAFGIFFQEYRKIWMSSPSS